MSLELAHERLGWPQPEEIREPPGEGARIFAGLAQGKIERAITARADCQGTKIGVLSPNPSSTETEAPLAVVAEFPHSASDEALRELQRLAWNFSHSPTVVTIESRLLRVWTCCEPPNDDRQVADYVVQQLDTVDLASSRPSDITKRAAQVLHWINLVSGQFFRDNAARFRRDHRADQSLLSNLQYVRNALRELDLTNDDVCHDLLARIIFVQFLFHRKDSNGNAALNANKLAALQESGVLKKEHIDFSSILDDYNETYRLFDWLNGKFNGDLFPGKQDTPRERETAWRQEKTHVKPEHLHLLRDFIRGDVDMPRGQLCLWPQYAFDAIPLEFISSIYEVFVKERARGEGIYYTPPHLVDFILDRVLPWDDKEWNLKILDPACGSGIFLVKAFQRLIHRWKKANSDEPLRAETLRGLLENNLFGVDKDPHAVRVASFSLYLAMCDEIDPKYYWSQVRFPQMRERRLIRADFFEEGRSGFSTKEEAGSYDIVVGNAPWGKTVGATELAKDWAQDINHQWPVVNKGIGTLFLSKAAALTKPEGKVAMIQSASALLFNRSGPARAFRKKFFTTFRVQEIVNLSALRFKVFARKPQTTRKSVAPSCVVVFQPELPDDTRFHYICPKQADDLVGEFDILLDPNDSKRIHPQAAAADSEVWSAFMWGQERDWALIKRLQSADSLASLRETGRVCYTKGIVRGKDPKRQQEHDHLLGRRILETDFFEGTSPVFLQASDLPQNRNPRAERPRKEDAFGIPQLLIKKSWSVEAKRFQARVVVPDAPGEGVVCSQSFLSVRSLREDEPLLEAACLSYNSLLAVYFLLLTSGRFASYRPEVLVEELPRVPIPEPIEGILDRINDNEDIDRRVRQAFGLKDAEWLLIEDLFNVTLPDFKGDEKSPGRQRTQRKKGSAYEPELSSYCQYFVRVLKAGFGQDKRITSTVFQESEHTLLPYRLVAFELNGQSDPAFRVEALDEPALVEELENVNRTWMSSPARASSGSIFRRRVASLYDLRKGNPTILIIKPDEYRYWTRSMGLRDADEVAADLAHWDAARSAAPNAK